MLYDNTWIYTAKIQNTQTEQDKRSSFQSKQIERGKKKEGGEGTHRLKDTEETIT